MQLEISFTILFLERLWIKKILRAIYFSVKISMRMKIISRLEPQTVFLDNSFSESSTQMQIFPIFSKALAEENFPLLF